MLSRIAGVALFLCVVSFALNPPAIAQMNQVLLLSGAGEYMEIPDVIDGLDQVTVEAWFRYENADTWRWIIGGGPGIVDGFGIVLGKDSQKLAPHIRTLGSGLSILSGNQTYNFSQGQWHHVAVVYDGSSVRGYANGELEYEVPKSGVLENLYAQAAIGAGNWNNYEYWLGAIDEVRIWGLSRTEAEIRRDRYVTLKGDEPGLVAYWNFDDGTPFDLSGNLNHGALVGGAAISMESLPWPAEDLVLHYDFAGFSGATVMDRSGHGNDGIAYNLSAVSNTVSGDGVFFDGTSSYIEVPGNSTLSLSNVTVAAWVRAENLGNTVNNGVLFSTEDFDHTRGGYAFAIGLGYGMNIGVRSAVASGTGFLASNVFGPEDNGAWRHLALTHRYSGGQHSATFYIDGIAVHSETKAGPSPFYDNQPAFIGTNYEGRPRGYSFSRELTGDMADIKVFARALSAREVFDLAGLLPTVHVLHAVEVCWPAVAGEAYQLQVASELSSGEWVDLGEAITATNSLVCVLDSSRDSANKVYRIQMLGTE